MTYDKLLEVVKIEAHNEKNSYLLRLFTVFVIASAGILFTISVFETTLIINLRIAVVCITTVFILGIQHTFYFGSKAEYMGCAFEWYLKRELGRVLTNKNDSLKKQITNLSRLITGHRDYL